MTSLPLVLADDETAILGVLVAQRDAAIAEATRLRNQAHQLLLQYDPCAGDIGHPLAQERLDGVTTGGLCWPCGSSVAK